MKKHHIGLLFTISLCVNNMLAGAEEASTLSRTLTAEARQAQEDAEAATRLARQRGGAGKPSKGLGSKFHYQALPKPIMTERIPGSTEFHIAPTPSPAPSGTPLPTPEPKSPPTPLPAPEPKSKTQTRASAVRGAPIRQTGAAIPSPIPETPPLQPNPLLQLPPEQIQQIGKHVEREREWLLGAEGDKSRLQKKTEKFFPGQVTQTGQTIQPRTPEPGKTTTARIPANQPETRKTTPAQSIANQPKPVAPQPRSPEWHEQRLQHLAQELRNRQAAAQGAHGLATRETGKLFPPIGKR